MCEAKPGLRCASDTRGMCEDAASCYAQTYPGGPPVNPLTDAQERHARASSAPAVPSTPSQLRTSLVQQHPGLQLWLEGPDTGGYVTLSKIVVPTRGAGVGTQVMEDIVRVADQHGWALALSPTSEFGSSKARLEQFYRRFGFVPNKGRSKDYATKETFIRPPSAR